jgi:hypothetical protein
VVYEIADLDIGKLDASEGFTPGRAKNAHYRRECSVYLDGNKRPLTVSAYFAEPQPNPPLPNTAYKNVIITRGTLALAGGIHPRTRTDPGQRVTKTGAAFAPAAYADLAPLKQPGRDLFADMQRP